MFRKIAFKAPLGTKCPLCPVTAITKTEMRKHLIKHHRNNQAFWIKKEIRKQLEVGG